MNSPLAKFLLFGLLFIVIFITGFWLSRSGKPYGVILFNLHKLIGLGAGIYLGVTIYNANKVTPLAPAQIAALVITGIFFLLTIVAGGLVSVAATGGLKQFQTVISTAHKILPYLTVLSSAATLYLIQNLL